MSYRHIYTFWVPARIEADLPAYIHVYNLTNHMTDYFNTDYIYALKNKTLADIQSDTNNILANNNIDKQKAPIRSNIIILIFKNFFMATNIENYWNLRMKELF